MPNKQEGETVSHEILFAHGPTCHIKTNRKEKTQKYPSDKDNYMFSNTDFDAVLSCFDFCLQSVYLSPLFTTLFAGKRVNGL